MNLLYKIRLKLAFYLLHQKAKARTRRFKAINLYQVQNLAVIFRVDEPENRKDIVNFLQPFLAKGVQCRVFGYVPDLNSRCDYMSDNTYTFFSEKDLNFFYEPQKEIVEDFIDIEWDMILIASQEFNFPIKWMLKLSQAKFKVGPSGLYDEDLDFVIEGKDLASNFIINQIEHYLGNMQIA